MTRIRHDVLVPSHLEKHFKHSASFGINRVQSGFIFKLHTKKPTSQCVDVHYRLCRYNRIYKTKFTTSGKMPMLIFIIRKRFRNSGFGLILPMLHGKTFLSLLENFQIWIEPVLKRHASICEKGLPNDADGGRREERGGGQWGSRGGATRVPPPRSAAQAPTARARLRRGVLGSPRLEPHFGRRPLGTATCSAGRSPVPPLPPHRPASGSPTTRIYGTAASRSRASAAVGSSLVRS
ncbi:unnamed protein product [Nesidiocoris tenuis]|uniref:Uncharacterized protein n=1 Tax=Nesidiocoris tenuis TaxID=355587 RepID=A0A6H5H616_9HEMI|nr:unnamed protein product [Nesidiocoris tenuis]